MSKLHRHFRAKNRACLTASTMDAALTFAAYLGQFSNFGGARCHHNHHTTSKDDQENGQEGFRNGGPRQTARKRTRQKANSNQKEHV